MKSVILAALLVGAHFANADVMEDFDSLGGNNILLERAKALNPETNVSVVQNRIVDRNYRVEFSPETTMVLGGDAYLKTSSLGANLNFHINPNWSLGAKYNTFYNKLNSEGESLVNDTASSGLAVVPEIDYPKNQTLGMLAWYPFYGKMNMFDRGIAHFDVYALLGSGTIELRSGKTSTWTAGGGVGFWISKHLSARMEMRYQTYKTQRSLGENKMDLTLASFQLGYLL